MSGMAWDEDLNEVLCRACEEGWNHLMAGLKVMPDLVRPVGEIDLRIEPDDAFDATIWSETQPGNYRIEITDGLLMGIHQALSQNSDRVLKAVSWPIGETDEPLVVPPDLVLEAVYDLAIQLVLQHELFHVLCGHLALVEMAGTTEGDGRGRRQTGRPTPEDRARAYFLELEADALAIEWLAGQVVYGSVENLLESLGSTPEDQPISWLEGDDRVVGFRVLTVAVWSVLALLEATREHGEDEHPYTSARLIAGLNTLGSAYGELAPDTVSPDGKAQLSSLEAAPVWIEFTREVALPVAATLLHFPDRHTAHQLALPRRENPLAILEDVSLLFADEPVQGRGALQLQQIVSSRFDMAERLRPHRYLDVMNSSITGQTKPGKF